MKIAILTLPLNHNYGGIIQNYALQTVLKRMGHEVETIKITKPEAKLQFKSVPLILTKRLIKKIIGRKDGIVFLENKMNKDKAIIEQNVRKFINKRIHQTKSFYTKKDLSEINDMKFDAVIVGFDQVWRIPFAYPDIETYFLDFLSNKNIIKLAFSASFGTDEMEFSDRQITSCGNLIKDFDFVSVREDAGVDLITKKYKWNLKCKPIHTLDPTMLLSKDDYINLITRKKSEKEGGLFYYILDSTKEKQDIINLISKEISIKPFTVKAQSDCIYDKPNERIVPPIEDWLEAFNRAIISLRIVFMDAFSR